ncbi:MAG: redox-sensing transcriptional repressor Rex [PVC group bacterium]
MISNGKIPRVVICRLSLYLRALNGLSTAEVATVSSAAIGYLVGVKPDQVRKDLACFGQFGIKGRGYGIGELIRAIIRILGTDRIHHVALIGVGNLGRSLLAYKGFEKRGFQIVAVFDRAGIGRRVGPAELRINDLSVLPEVVREKKVRIGIIAVPAEAGQDVANRLVKAGIKAILNFAPVGLVVPDDVQVENIDLAIGLEGLAYNLKVQG